LYSIFFSVLQKFYFLFLSDKKEVVLLFSSNLFVCSGFWMSCKECNKFLQVAAQIWGCKIFVYSNAQLSSTFHKIVCVRHYVLFSLARTWPPPTLLILLCPHQTSTTLRLAIWISPQLGVRVSSYFLEHFTSLADGALSTSVDLLSPKLWVQGKRHFLANFTFEKWQVHCEIIARRSCSLSCSQVSNGLTYFCENVFKNIKLIKINQVCKK
jgi:hypothetical protein